MADTKAQNKLAETPIYKSLADIQAELKVEKGQYNAYGKYSYRSKEDILEAAKKVCHKHGCALCIDDRIDQIGGWIYCRSVASIVNTSTGASVSATGWAREPEARKGMDASQITGCASSYAGKRALGNLFAIDDTKDADGLKPETSNKAATKSSHVGIPFVGVCKSCGTRYEFVSATQFEQFKDTDQAKCCPNPQWEVEC